MWVVREGERMWIKGDGDEEEEEKGDDVVHNISLPLQGLLLLLSLFYEMCEKKITFSCTRSFIGAPMELFTQFSQSPFRFPGRFREKRARGSVCPATGVNVDWISHTAQERKQQKDRRKSNAADVARTKRILDPFFSSCIFLFLFCSWLFHPSSAKRHTHAHRRAV